MGKKRKSELDLDLEQNMHTSFVAAANSISQLYTQAIQQQKRAQAEGARQALVRDGFGLREVVSYLQYSTQPRFFSCAVTHRSAMSVTSPCIYCFACP